MDKLLSCSSKQGPDSGGALWLCSSSLRGHGAYAHKNSEVVCAEDNVNSQWETTPHVILTNFSCPFFTLVMNICNPFPHVSKNPGCMKAGESFSETRWPSQTVWSLTLKIKSRRQTKRDRWAHWSAAPLIFVRSQLSSACGRWGQMVCQ